MTLTLPSLAVHLGPGADPKDFDDEGVKQTMICKENREERGVPRSNGLTRQIEVGFIRRAFIRNGAGSFDLRTRRSGLKMPAFPAPLRLFREQISAALRGKINGF